MRLDILSLDILALDILTLDIRGIIHQERMYSFTALKLLPLCISGKIIAVPYTLFSEHLLQNEKQH